MRWTITISILLLLILQHIQVSAQVDDDFSPEILIPEQIVEVNPKEESGIYSAYLEITKIGGYSIIVTTTALRMDTYVFNNLLVIAEGREYGQNQPLCTTYSSGDDIDSYCNFEILTLEFEPSSIGVVLEYDALNNQQNMDDLESKFEIKFIYHGEEISSSENIFLNNSVVNTHYVRIAKIEENGLYNFTLFNNYESFTDLTAKLFTFPYTSTTYLGNYYGQKESKQLYLAKGTIVWAYISGTSFINSGEGGYIQYNLKYHLIECEFLTDQTYEIDGTSYYKIPKDFNYSYFSFNLLDEMRYTYMNARLFITTQDTLSYDLNEISGFALHEIETEQLDNLQIFNSVYGSEYYSENRYNNLLIQTRTANIYSYNPDQIKHILDFDTLTRSKLKNSTMYLSLSGKGSVKFNVSNLDFIELKSDRSSSISLTKNTFPSIFMFNVDTELDKLSILGSSNGNYDQILTDYDGYGSNYVQGYLITPTGSVLSLTPANSYDKISFEYPILSQGDYLLVFDITQSFTELLSLEKPSSGNTDLTDLFLLEFQLNITLQNTEKIENNEELEIDLSQRPFYPISKTYSFDIVEDSNYEIIVNMGTLNTFYSKVTVAFIDNNGLSPFYDESYIYVGYSITMMTKTLTSKLTDTIFVIVTGTGHLNLTIARTGYQVHNQVLTASNAKSFQTMINIALVGLILMAVYRLFIKKPKM